MTKTQHIAFVTSRVFAASAWYGAEYFPSHFALYAKTRELIAGDRAQAICQKVIDEERSNG
ncbi:hypothetical protein [Morganella morganii]|uniref:hypothetical protein n=1 Tax=Morganella morganii TaxID=582 RepID=UPI001BDAF94C|nr:hypothetical protein [Morganella morganii]MBT0456886.1 hypothetical protein [Morganella morganii subsp. morganii]